MKVGFVLPLACALALKSSLDTAGSLTVDPCRLGFSQNFYTVFIPQEWLQGHTVVKGTMLSSGQVKFEACHTNERISFESSDPKFGVRPDGSVYAERDLMHLSEPVQFVVTAQGSKDMPSWKTIIKLVITRHPRPPLINQIVDQANSQAHHNRYHNLSQLQGGFSTNGLHWQKRDWIIPPISAPENSRRAFPLFLARGNAGGPTVDPCRPGFSQNFYTVFIPREQLQGQSIVKGLTELSADDSTHMRRTHAF